MPDPRVVIVRVEVWTSTSYRYEMNTPASPSSPAVRRRSSRRLRPVRELRLVHDMVREEALQRLEVRRRIQGGARRHLPLRLRIDDGRLGHGPGGRTQARLLRRAAPPERRARCRAGDSRRVEGREG